MTNFLVCFAHHYIRLDLF